jgi:hypothetical protein
LYPAGEEVLAFQERSTVCWRVAPIPLAVSAVGELEALLENEILAERVPDTCGANTTVNGTL